MFLNVSRNEFGTPIDVYQCEHCGDKFSICPANDDRTKDEDWAGCLARSCASYDPSRDADLLFDDGNVISFASRYGSAKVYRTRATGAQS